MWRIIFYKNFHEMSNRWSFLNHFFVEPWKQMKNKLKWSTFLCKLLPFPLWQNCKHSFYCVKYIPTHFHNFSNSIWRLICTFFATKKIIRLIKKCIHNNFCASNFIWTNMIFIIKWITNIQCLTTKLKCICQLGLTLPKKIIYDIWV